MFIFHLDFKYLKNKISQDLDLAKKSSTLDSWLLLKSFYYKKLYKNVVCQLYLKKVVMLYHTIHANNV